MRSLACARALMPACLAEACLAAACLAPAGASAAPNRVWISGHGVDQAGCGAPASPCRSLQFAHDTVAAGGEIDILDPAGYGAVTITKAVSIVNDGVGASGVQATSGAAITINAGAADSVFLRGLVIDGVQGQATDGIQFNSGRTLFISNCTVRHFASNGVLIQPTAGVVSVTIVNSLFAENLDGINSNLPTGSTANLVETLDRVIATRNAAYGALVELQRTGTAKVAVLRSVFNDNQIEGLGAGNLSLSGVDVWLVVDESHFDANGSFGLEADARTEVHLSRSVLDLNGSYGLENSTCCEGKIYTSGDNHIDGNVTGAVSGVTPTLEPLS